MEEIKRRLKAPTPKIFKKIRNACLMLGAVGTAIVTAPVALPASLIAIGGYLVAIGGVGAAVSQLTEDKSKQ